MPIRAVTPPLPIITPRARTRAVPGVPPSPPKAVATYAFDMMVEDATALYQTAMTTLIQRGSGPTAASQQLTTKDGHVDVGACIRTIMVNAVKTLADLSACPVTEPVVYMEMATERPGYGADDGTGR